MHWRVLDGAMNPISQGSIGCMVCYCLQQLSMQNEFKSIDHSCCYIPAVVTLMDMSSFSFFCLVEDVMELKNCSPSGSECISDNDCCSMCQDYVCA